MHDHKLRSADHLAETLVRSNLASPDQLQHAQQQMPGHASAAELASQLVHDGVLTDYQAATAMRNGIASLMRGDYVILDKIGQGSMGQVFKAMHRPMERIVALKVLARLAAVSQETVERFRREAEVVASLDHPNIVRAYDARVDRERTYLIMEYVDGVDLATLVEREGALPTRLACQYVLQAARGLAHAHQQNIVHRDVKPSNLIVDPAGIVKVLDLGVARLQTSSLPDEAAESRLTDEGQVLGTVAFMAPEQAEDSRFADEKSDVYSLGCTLYFLLTGRLPFSGASIFETFAAHRNEPVPSLREFRLDASARLQHLFERTVAKDPRLRFSSMHELIDDLESCIKDQPTAVSQPLAKVTHQAPTRWKRKRDNPSTETVSFRGDQVNATAPARPSGAPPVARSLYAFQRGPLVLTAACLTAALILSTSVYVYCHRYLASDRTKATSPPASDIETRQPDATVNVQRPKTKNADLDSTGEDVRPIHKHNPGGFPESIEKPLAGITARQTSVPLIDDSPRSNTSGSKTPPTEPLARTRFAVASVAKPVAAVESTESKSAPPETPPGFTLTLIAGKRREMLSDLEAALKRLESFIDVRERAEEKGAEELPFVATVTVGDQQFALYDASDALEICKMFRSAAPADDLPAMASRIAGPAIDVKRIQDEVNTYVQQQFPRHLNQWVDEKRRLPEDRDVRRMVMKIVAVGKTSDRVPLYFQTRYFSDELADSLAAVLAEKTEQWRRDASTQASFSATPATAILMLPPSPAPPPPPPRSHHRRSPPR